MGEQWAAIDFELANTDRHSACAIGLARFDMGGVQDSRSWLIKPPEMFFYGYNVMIHGITEADVVNAPTFEQLWPELQDYIGDRSMIAHYAAFDIHVLRHVLDHYGIGYPTFDYLCTRALSRKVFGGLPSYRLDMLAEMCGFECNHHDAEDDALTCAKIALRCAEERGVTGLHPLAESVNCFPGHLSPDAFRPSRMLHSKGANGKNSTHMVPEDDLFDADHPFYAKTLVFTGTLQSMVRAVAMQQVVNVGGRCTSAVSDKTNFLVIGDLDFTKFREGTKSNKMKKAEAQLALGDDIEVVSEDEFLRLLGAVA